MIEIDDKIVSLDLLRECFACDLSRCKGHLLRQKATPAHRSKSRRSQRSKPSTRPTSPT